MRLYLTVRPEDVREAAPYRRELAHAAYHIGEESALLRRNLLVQTSGGLLVLSDRGAPPVEDPEGLAGALLRECGRRSYSGIVLDFEMPPRRDLSDLAAALGRSCAAGHRPLYLPEAYAKLTAHRIVIINTAVSGGSFEEHLREVISLYGGSQHIALDVQLLRMCFSLPAPTGLGEPLTPEKLDTLLHAQGPAVFFSRDLCARYFTCTRSGQAQFILFDDAGTLRQKLRLGQQLGVAAAFFQWPEISNIAPELFAHS